MDQTAVQKIQQKIDDNTLLVGIIGLGYVGLPLVLRFLHEKIRVMGFDVDQNKIELLMQGKSYLQQTDFSLLPDALREGIFEPSYDFSKLSLPDVLIICVPTPLTVDQEPDLQFVRKTTADIAAALRPGQLVVLESTTYPGTTVDVVQPRLEASGLKAGRDFFLAYSPERVDPGNTSHSLREIPKLVAGIDSLSLKLAKTVYFLIFDSVVPVSSTQAAEMAKLLENIFRSVNIALVNELKVLCLKMGIDVWEVIGAAASKPFGFMPFYPGPGLGGHCIPIDPFYLAAIARKYEMPARFIELAGEVNTAMPLFVVQRLSEALHARGVKMHGAKVLILGAAYKKDVDDCRESPSFMLIDILQKQGARVSYNDPYIPQLKPVRKYSFTMRSEELSKEKLADADCVLLATDHSEYDYDFIHQHARLIVDTRNVFKARGISSDKIVPA